MMMMAKHTIVRFGPISFLVLESFISKGAGKGRGGQEQGQGSIFGLSGGYDYPQERLRSHLGFRAGTQRVGGAMAERDEEPTAFSVVVNG